MQQTNTAIHGNDNSKASAESSRKREVQSRNRAIKACMECRRRKTKCNKEHPCSACAKDNRDCSYVPEALEPEEQERLNQIKKRTRALESTLERQVAKPAHAKKIRERPADNHLGASDSGTDEDRLEATHFVNAADAYEDDTDDDDNVPDVAIKLGKFRLTDRVDGYFGSRMAEELTSLLEHDTSDVYQSSNHISVSAGASSFGVTQGPTYLAPVSPFFFSDSLNTDIYDCYPTKFSADILLKQYWKCVHPIARTVHQPSFERVYSNFFLYTSPPQVSVSTQALVFAVLFSAIVSMNDKEYIHIFGYSKQTWLRKLQLATETLLCRAHIYRTTKLKTLQAFVVYLVPLCRADVGRVHSTLVASAIRIAECVRLHQDGTENGLSAIVTHVRRMVWYQLCILDIRTAETIGLRPIIRKEDYTTKLPLNLDDTELELPEPPNQDADRLTDMTLSRIRMECNEMIRQVYVERNRVGKGPDRISVTQLLWNIFDFRNRLRDRYFPILDRHRAIQDYALQIIRLFSSQMTGMILARYQMSANEGMPERLRQLLVDTGIDNLDVVMTIETEETYKPWRWY